MSTELIIALLVAVPFAALLWVLQRQRHHKVVAMIEYWVTSEGYELIKARPSYSLITPFGLGINENDSVYKVKVFDPKQRIHRTGHMLIRSRWGSLTLKNRRCNIHINDLEVRYGT